MSRNYYRRKGVDSLEGDVLGFISSVSVLIVLYFAFVYYSNKTQFWHEMNHYVFPTIGVIVFCIIAYVFYLYQANKKKNSHFESLIQKIIDSGFETKINHFIDMRGKEGKIEPWTYRDYKFNLTTIEDFREVAIQDGIEISTKDNEELFSVLKYFLAKKDKKYLNDGLGAKLSYSLNDLSRNGDDFENLVVRLYDSMGYSSKRIGGHGDQGGDVIANKNGDSLLIQAKDYHGSVGNAAVQQAVAARLHHGCTKAIVITTAYFTPEAITLAKSNSVELIEGQLLKQKLVEYLHENWL